MNKADEKLLGEIHGSLAEWCVMILKGVPLLDKEGNAVLKPDGQPWLVPPSHQHMGVIRQFLKDNKIEATEKSPLHDASDLDDLPVFDDDNVVQFKR